MHKNILLAFLLYGICSCASTSNSQGYIAPSEIKNFSKIVITREDALLYLGVSANIKLNGKKVGSLAKGSTEIFFAPEGRNFISITGTGSPGESTLSFNTKKGETYSLLISPRGGNTLVGGILGGALYMAIEADGTSGGLFSLKLNSSSEEQNKTVSDNENRLLELKDLYNKGLISDEVYEKRQLELLQ